MSLSAILIPLVVAICISSSEAIKCIQEKASDGKLFTEGVQTQYNNSELLYKTLLEHGFSINRVSSDCMIVKCLEGELMFKRGNETESYRLYLQNISDTNALICELNSLDEEYGCNVQSYVYERTVKNLSENMVIEDEKILDDDSIMLTISVQ